MQILPLPPPVTASPASLVGVMSLGVAPAPQQHGNWLEPEPSVQGRKLTSQAFVLGEGPFLSYSSCPTPQCSLLSNALPRKAQQPSTKVLLFNASLSPQSPRVGCFLSLPPVLDSGQGQILAFVTSIWAVMTVLNAVGPCGLQYTMGTGTFQKRRSQMSPQSSFRHSPVAEGLQVGGYTPEPEGQRGLLSGTNIYNSIGSVILSTNTCGEPSHSRSCAKH